MAKFWCTILLFLIETGTVAISIVIVVGEGSFKIHSDYAVILLCIAKFEILRTFHMCPSMFSQQISTSLNGP